LVLGNEVNGVDEEVLKLVKGSIEIEQHGTKHSLNVAVSGGIALFHLTLRDTI
jgi:tRNA G18 (ribose-2'-O)-methylase SpoU